MIDKKPFRVTNEELNKTISRTDIAFHSAKYVKVISLDLLDARELIDEQEALIKEMREVLSSNLRDMDKIDQVCAMAGVHPYTIMRSEIFAVLEKTKDYA